jgi:uncharacterized membrane protein
MIRIPRALRTSLRVVPLGCLLGGILLSVATIAIDRRFHGPVPMWPTGPSMSARTVLSAIASSMMTLITLVLTVTTVAVQPATGQFSPRIVRALLDDRQSQPAHGLFLATFAYALLAIRELDRRYPDSTPRSPQRVRWSWRHDAAGRLRLVVRLPTWDTYVRLAFDEIRLAGARTTTRPIAPRPGRRISRGSARGRTSCRSSGGDRRTSGRR